MPIDLDFAYLSRRAHEENAASAEATHPGAQSAHAEMARRYESLALLTAQCVPQLHLFRVANGTAGRGTK